jgi:hypothetical protein
VIEKHNYAEIVEGRSVQVMINGFSGNTGRTDGVPLIRKED